MIGKYKKHLAVVILALLGVFTHIIWFNPGTTLTNGDWQYRGDRVSETFWHTNTVWTSFTDFGGPNATLYSYPLRGILWSSIVKLGFTYDQAVKITLLIPIAILGFLSPYFLARRLTKVQLIAVAVAIFYGSTTYFLRKQTNHLPLAMVYALAPLIILTLIDALKYSTYRKWTIFTVLLSLVSIYDARIFFVILPVLVIYVLVFHKVQYVLKTYGKHILYSVLLYLVLNAYWIVPTALGGLQGAISEITDRSLFGDSLFSTLQALNLFEYSWTGGRPNGTFTPQPVLFYFLTLTLLILSTLLFVKKAKIEERKYILFFLTVSLLGIFLTKQSDPPLSGFYEWAYKNIPAFSLFREASKFYLLTAVGFFGLLTYSLVNLKRKYDSSRRWVYYSSLSLVFITCALNLFPLVSGSIGTLFADRTMPKDYRVLNKYLAQQPDYFRTFWLPATSRWNEYSLQHPQISAVTQTSLLSDEKGIASYEAAINFFNRSYAKSFLDKASIKYVIVPLRDETNDDDFFSYYGNDRQMYVDTLNNTPWLKKINIGAPDLAIYENNGYRPYVEAFKNLYTIDEGSNVDDADKLVTSMSDVFNFAYRTDRKASYPQKRVVDIFNNLKPDSFNNGILSSRAENRSRSDIYSRSSYPELNQEIRDNRMIFSAVYGSKLVSGEDEIENNRNSKLLQSIEIEDKKYYLKIGDKVEPVNSKTNTTSYGLVKQPVSLIAADKNNIVKDGVIGEDFLKSHSMQCSKEEAPDKNESSIVGAENRGKILELRAAKDSACVKTRSFSVQSGKKYLLKLDYRSMNTPRVEYELNFQDGQNITQRITVFNNRWHTHYRLVSIPEGAKELSIALKGLQSGSIADRNIGITNFDNISMAPVQDTSIYNNVVQRYASIGKGQDASKVRYIDNGISDANLVKGGSFEQGLWRKDVNDCNNYDDSPKVYMRTANVGSRGSKSLELEASRHSACTGPSPIEVQENSTYLLSFDYQSPISSNASYNISFDDGKEAAISGDLSSGKNWKSFNKVIEVPYGVKKANLLLYANASKGKKTLVRYDNVKLVRVPDVRGQYFGVSSDNEFVQPNTVRLTKSTATMKSIEVNGARGPFYLSIAEGYHPNWKLRLNKTTGGYVNLMPFGLSDILPNSDHIKLNNAFNGWYIDPAKSCSAIPEGCTKNQDGSYDMKIVAEFTSQRWFNLGALISGFGLVGALVVIMRIKRYDEVYKKV